MVKTAGKLKSNYIMHTVCVLDHLDKLIPEKMEKAIVEIFKIAEAE